MSGHLDFSRADLQRKTLGNQICGIWDGLFCADSQSGTISNPTHEKSNPVEEVLLVHRLILDSYSSSTKRTAEEMSECMTGL